MGGLRVTIKRTLAVAVRALARNKLRAGLTVLGIVIGIAAVIAMMEIGAGSSREIQKNIAAMGAENVLILPGTAASSGISWGAGSSPTLTVQDAEAISSELEVVRAVAPIVRARVQAVYQNRNWVPSAIYGTTPEYLVVRDWQSLTEGEPFSERDVRNGTKVCLIGQTIVRELFQGESPIGREIRLQNVPFVVIGVLAKKGGNVMGHDQDDVVVAPWTTVKSRLSGATTQTASSDESSRGSAVQLYPENTDGKERGLRIENVDQILFRARSAAEIQQAIDQVTQLLRQRHRLRPDEPDDFGVRNMAEMSKVLTTTSKLMTRLLLTVALIALVVGGVGIMNIMLVSVTERTREIGIRMAVGATGRDILQQFLVEAVVLCLCGGVLGFALGRGCSLLVRHFLKWPVEASLSAVGASLLVALTVGVVFGFYPAWKASRFDPIEALRYE
jgi:ABC-type antimicrobial peptide transport system permease subunit